MAGSVGMSMRSDLPRRRFRACSVLVLSLPFLAYGQTGSAPQVDIRVVGQLDTRPDAVSYEATVGDCSRLRTAELRAGNVSTVLTVTESSRVPDTASACRFAFAGGGNGRFDPMVELKFSDDTTLSYGEHYVLERQSPTVKLIGASLTGSGNGQVLVVRAQVGDDIDISAVDFNVTGLRASQLRAVGGVVSEARKQAFADSGGTITVLPLAPRQSEYSVSIPVRAALDAQAIASDGLVLVSIAAYDSSGNRTNISELTFTGQGITEQAQGLSVAPARIVFTDLLQSAALLPTVQFQFRGPTPLPGDGTGVTYESSNPDFVAVTSGGLVYPLRETAGLNANVTVRYPGAPPSLVPVEVNFRKRLTALEVDPAALDNGRLRLKALNAWTELPPLRAVFDDGSSSELGGQIKLDYLFGPGAAGLIEIDAAGRLRSKAVISDQAPVSLTIRVRASPDVKIDLPIVASDGLPTVTMTLPATAATGSALELIAMPVDDVAIKEVRFFMGGTSVGTRDKPPYRVTVQIPDALAGQSIEFQATAVDSAGQSGSSPRYPVRIEAQATDDLPNDALLELPVDLQRYVEQAPIRIQVAIDLGPVAEASRSTINYVEFFIDGTRVGESSFPLLEMRPDPADETGKKMLAFELWRLDSLLGGIATDETSASVSAVIHGARTGKPLAAKLIRIIRNQPPVVSIVQPAAGSSASVGQTLPIDIRVSDDLLAVGVDLDLFVNDTVVEHFHYDDPAGRLRDSISTTSVVHRYSLPIAEDLLGSTLHLRARAIDFHQRVAETPVLNIRVKGDSPPDVAVSYPQQGSRFVAGLPIELRAEAVDDVGVSRVEFHADGRLLGSDSSAPYSFVYPSDGGIDREQTVTVTATAYDSKNQSRESVPVTFVLGKDEEPPVVNLVSPAVTLTEAGASIAEVVENSDVVLKATGYDNVGIKSLALQGVRQQGAQFLLTGDPGDRITGDEFAVQPVPGARRRSTTSVAKR